VADLILSSKKEPDPEGAGRGRQEIRRRSFSRGPVGPGSMSVQAVFRAHTTLLDPTGREGLLLGYKDIQGL
jgi:hypothetical protein